jgi:hypothetical protein
MPMKRNISHIGIFNSKALQEEGLRQLRLVHESAA